jgi:hypothetical protein
MHDSIYITPHITTMDDEIRQPDEARYETLTPMYAFDNANANIQHIEGRRRRIKRQGQNQRQNQMQELDDPELDAAIQASLAEQISIAAMLQEIRASAERDCMSISDAESLASTNLDRHLAVAKTQCMKLGRFDADYFTALRWIRTGLFSAIDERVLNKLKQVRLPAAELDIICRIHV